MAVGRRTPISVLGLCIFAVAVVVGAPHAAAVEPDFADVQYASVGGQVLFVDVYLPTTGSGPFPVVVHLHGGGWFSGDKYPLDDPVLDLLNNGIAIVSVQYRLTGNSWTFGDDLRFPAQIHDVKGAVRWLRANAGTYNIDPTRVGVWGSSAGAHVAALLAVSGGVAELEGTIGGNLNESSRVSAAASYSGPMDLMNENPDFMGLPGHQDQDFYFSTRSRLIGWSRVDEGIGDIRANEANLNEPYPTLVAVVQRASPLTHVSSDDPPFFIAHGDVDKEVPVLQATKLEQALLAVGVDVEKHIIAGVGHDELPASVDVDMVAFMVSKLAVDATGPSAPVLNTVTAISESQIDLSWAAGVDAKTGVAEYVVYRDSVAIARVPGEQLSYSDTGLESNTTYDYEIAAVNGQITESTKSNVVQGQTIADTTGPGVVAVQASGVVTTVTVSFDEVVEQISAETTGNYTITPGVSVIGASLQGDGQTVVLTTTAHAAGEAYSLNVSNVEDTTGNVIDGGGRGGADVPYTFGERVRDGLVVLYDFEQGSGDIVPDVSGVGQPMDLDIEEPGNVTWTAHGLRLTNTTEVSSQFWATKIIEACQATNELTLETWVTPANTTQDGPARMITLSSVYHKRNFTLGPGETEWVWLVRSTNTDTNGVPLLVSPMGDVSTNLTHVVCTWNAAGETKLYVNGQLRNSDNIGGDLSNWASPFRFVLGNEPVDDGGFDIDWLGEFHHVAVYDRALADAEVQINFDAGADPDDGCVADIDGNNNVVDVFDLLALLSNWGTDGAGAAIAPPTDIVDVFDLLDLLSAWGGCP